VVLIYEGIVANVLDFDYAPQSDLIENRRVWLNISQEGKSDIEFLREVCYELCDRQGGAKRRSDECYCRRRVGRDVLLVCASPPLPPRH